MIQSAYKEGGIKGVSYRPLWIELAKRDIKKIEFQELTGVEK